VTTDADRGRLAILAHEVRSPVAALVAIAEALAEDVSEGGAPRRELVALAVGACDGIARIVGDAALGSVRLQAVDIGRVAADTAAAARLRGGNVHTEIDATLEPILADPQRLRQALDNLVSNAVAHSPPDERVVVTVRSGDRDVLIAVANTGEGIPANEQARIFEPGVRLTTDRPGSGLGLAVARSIAKAHGGTLMVDSVPGEGATFTLSLPSRRQP
jgi:signal transduction histidine kinase